MPDASNDGPAPPGAESSHSKAAHGEAALLLVESLIHDLLARSILSTEQALDVVQTAIDIQREIGDERGDDPAVDSVAVQLLAAISRSIRTDQPR